MQWSGSTTRLPKFCNSMQSTWRLKRSKRTAITPLNTGTEHEFFGHVCEALAKIPEVLVVGPKTGLAHFEHYTKKHSPDTATRIVGFEVVDHPTEKQLVASARKHFLKHDRMIGIPTPT